jgi:hypothetical protein
VEEITFFFSGKQFQVKTSFTDATHDWLQAVFDVHLTHVLRFSQMEFTA